MLSITDNAPAPWEARPSTSQAALLAARHSAAHNPVTFTKLNTSSKQTSSHTGTEAAIAAAEHAEAAAEVTDARLSFVNALAGSIPMSGDGIFGVNPWGEARKHKAKHNLSHANRDSSFIIDVLVLPSWASHDQIELGVMWSVLWSRTILNTVDTPVLADPAHVLSAVWVRADDIVSSLAWCPHDEILASHASQWPLEEWETSEGFLGAIRDKSTIGTLT